MRLLHAVSRTSAVFDEANLVSRAGLVPAVRLAENVGVEALVGEHVKVRARVGVNAGLKVGTLVAGMVAGADCIDDMEGGGPAVWRARRPREGPVLKTYRKLSPSAAVALRLRAVLCRVTVDSCATWCLAAACRAGVYAPGRTARARGQRQSRIFWEAGSGLPRLMATVEDVGVNRAPPLIDRNAGASARVETRPALPGWGAGAASRRWPSVSIHVSGPGTRRGGSFSVATSLGVQFRWSRWRPRGGVATPMPHPGLVITRLAGRTTRAAEPITAPSTPRSPRPQPRGL